jgi:glycosyltransferase involved in cell wall biosynthesis
MDITAVINAHDEGLLAQASLLSLHKSVLRARAAGLSVEILAVLDRADSLTAAMLDNFSAQNESCSVYSIDVGDLGLARNHAARNAKGKWIAFLDADDIWSSNWLTSAHAAANSESREVVWHPEVNVYFENSVHLMTHVDMDDPDFNISRLACANAWTSLCFVRTGLLREVPYPMSDLRSGKGYEDWSWNMEVIDQGAIHKVVRGSAHAVRRRTRSLLTRTNALQCLPSPTALFRRILAARRVTGLRENPVPPIDSPEVKGHIRASSGDSHQTLTATS